MTARITTGTSAIATSGGAASASSTTSPASFVVPAACSNADTNQHASTGDSNSFDHLGLPIVLDPHATVDAVSPALIARSKLSSVN